jgi:alpha,alpha-trehalase
MQKTTIHIRDYRALILDMDGVVTRSAKVHLRAWERMFNDYLETRPPHADEDRSPFSEKDYYRYVDGKPRYDGTQSFLCARGITLPYGSPSDPPEKESVCGLGNRKNRYFRKYLEKHGAESYSSTVDLIRKFRKAKKAVACISSSKNAKAVLRSAGVIELFDAIVDGVDAAEAGFPGKPAPDIFLAAAERLGADPGKSIVIEDALSGVEAGKAGGFGLVIGVDRGKQEQALRNRGADIVVPDLSMIRSVYDKST